MNAEQYVGRTVRVKSTDQEGIIKSVKSGLNAQKIRTIRLIVDDTLGRPIEYMPHEVEFIIPAEELKEMLEERNAVVVLPDYVKKYPLTQSDATE